MDKAQSVSGRFRNKLFFKYFSIYATLVLTSIFVLGVVLLVFSSRFFERDKQSSMQKYINQAVVITQESYKENRGEFVERAIISMSYSIISKVLEGELFLADINGNIVFYSNSGVEEEEKLTLKGNRVPEITINSAITNGYYKETGNLMGFYNFPRYTVAVPVVADGEAFGVLYASCPANDMVKFLIEMLKMFLWSAIVVFAFSCGIIYLLAAKMVKPLKVMLDATHSFAKGDFSQRVPVSDYDEIGQLSMAFNNMASTLATTESARRSFVANVSHELKTPMTTISGFVDGILDGTIPQEKHSHYLSVVSNECKRLSRLVRSMLDTSRIEAGELEVNPVSFDISEIIRQTVFSFEHAIDEAHLEIAGLETDKVMVYADKDLMHQVVYNLVDNAVKFVDEGGYIAFSYTDTPKMVFVSIRNSGKGIEREEATRLFDRFYKSDKSRSLNTSGVGLGLHIARSIVNYHEGEINVKSVLGEYTEFRFSVPKAQEKND